MIWSQIVQLPSEIDLLKIIGIIANFAIIATFFIYWRQLLAMQGQLKIMQDSNHEQIKTMQDASQSQNILTFINYLQQQDIRDARGTLRRLKNKPYKEWSSEELKDAGIVATSYDLAGIFARQEIVPLDLIVDNWGDSIKECYIAAKPMIAEYRKKSGPYFIDDFEWLYKEVEKNPRWKEKND